MHAFQPAAFDVALKRFGTMFFADQVGAFDIVVSDGDCAVSYGQVSGTNTGGFFGMPSTGKTAEFGHIDICRIGGGRITEAWPIEDIAGLMRQVAPAVARRA